VRLTWLIAALVPYVSIAAMDAWIHEKGRQVPMAEQWVHAGLAVFWMLFIVLAFKGMHPWAVGALSVFCGLVALDEIRYHRGIAIRERRIHIASWAALAVFVLVWYLIDR
jgi:hypothetical protein